MNINDTGFNDFQLVKNNGLKDYIERRLTNMINDIMLAVCLGFKNKLEFNLNYDVNPLEILYNGTAIITNNKNIQFLNTGKFLLTRNGLSNYESWLPILINDYKNAKEFLVKYNIEESKKGNIEIDFTKIIDMLDNL